MTFSTYVILIYSPNVSLQMPCFITKFLVNGIEDAKAQNLIILDFLRLAVKLSNLTSRDRIIFVCSMTKRKYGKKTRE